jgi:hypothetical protein
VLEQSLAADHASAASESFSEALPLDATVTLMAATRALYSAWRQSSDPEERTALTAAGTLAAHAAIDSLLNDWATRERPDLAAWRTGTMLSRAARFTAALGRGLPPFLADLSRARHALGRAAPSAERRQVLDWMRGDGMERAYLTMLDIEAAVGVSH